MNRQEIADLIVDRLNIDSNHISSLVHKTKSDIGYFYIDDLLPLDYALKIFNSFPNVQELVAKKSIRERKYVGAQMDRYNPLIEESIYAFQDKRIVDFIANAFDLNAVYPDPYLYAGGISIMKKGDFLNPHLDNSHDKDLKRWRVLNLLYYVTPDWNLEYGGNLEVWNSKLGSEKNTIHSKFNRLVVMATHDKSWHSVSPVEYNGTRCCISNYYFSDFSSKENQAFHVTSFRGRPEEKIYNIMLRFDSYVRMLIRKIFRYGIRNQSHIYKNKND